MCLICTKTFVTSINTYIFSCLRFYLVCFCTSADEGRQSTDAADGSNQLGLFATRETQQSRKPVERRGRLGGEVVPPLRPEPVVGRRGRC